MQNGAGLKEATRLFLFDPAIAAHRVADDRWQIDAAESAAPRDGALWAVGPNGVAGPLRFNVSLAPQIMEQDPMTRLPRRSARQPSLALTARPPIFGAGP